MSTAFLLSDDKFLMMKRAENRVFNPGIWAGVGGHLEKEEISNPFASCLREIEEETGLTSNDISGLKLRYIIHRLSSKNNEIRQQYVYFGNALRREVTQTDEGQLHWIESSKLLSLKSARTTFFIFQHYLDKGKESSDIFVGSVFNGNQEARVCWTPLQDWEE